MKRINNRGPDCIHEIEFVVNNTTLYFCGSVLWMQGAEPTPQPVENGQGILLYNGDIFERCWDDKMSDTIFIMEKLSNVMYFFLFDFLMFKFSFNTNFRKSKEV